MRTQVQIQGQAQPAAVHVSAGVGPETGAHKHRLHERVQAECLAEPAAVHASTGAGAETGAHMYRLSDSYARCWMFVPIECAMSDISSAQLHLSELCVIMHGVLVTQ